MDNFICGREEAMLSSVYTNLWVGRGPHDSAAVDLIYTTENIAKVLTDRMHFRPQLALWLTHLSRWWEK